MSILGEGPRIRKEEAMKRADFALRLAATRETEGIPQMRRSCRATRPSRRTSRISRPFQKTEGPPATGTRGHVPMLMDPRHDRREGAKLRPGMANNDYMKCTQRQDRAYILNRRRCYHLMVAAPPGDVEIEEESHPPHDQDTPEDR